MGCGRAVAVLSLLRPREAADVEDESSWSSSSAPEPTSTRSAYAAGGHVIRNPMVMSATLVYGTLWTREHATRKSTRPMCAMSAAASAARLMREARGGREEVSGTI